MINQIRTLDFLPEVFRTPTNAQFLAASLDVVTSQPNLQRVQGFIGEKYGYSVEPNDKYVVEPTKTRADYQLDPSVVFLKKDTQEAKDFINYPGIIKALANQGAVTDNNDRLFNNDFYSWDSFVDLDKLVNYSQYYWIPSGPDSVVVSNSVIPTFVDTPGFTVVNAAGKFTIGPEIGFSYDNTAKIRPTITLLRGGSYAFTVNGPTPFWIQGAQSVTGFGNQNNLNTRLSETDGVINNGATTGEIIFNVPAKDSQAEYNVQGNLAVDLLSTLPFSDINGKTVASIPSIDGITQYTGKTLLFYNNGEATSQISFYTITEVSGIINLVPASSTIPSDTKITVSNGIQWAGRSLYKDIDTSLIVLIPYLPSVLDTLYYQDPTNPENYGVIRLVDNNATNEINIDDIIGKKNYISPNGVTFINGLKVRFTGAVVPASYADQEYYVEGVGESITLLTVKDYLSIETGDSGFYIPWDTTGWSDTVWDQSLFVAITPDYLTISRNSRDMNAWTRSNRWFNIEVLNATKQYNGYVTKIAGNEPTKAQRPIIEFDGNLSLWNSGSSSLGIVDYVATSNSTTIVDQTDALRDFVGLPSYDAKIISDGEVFVIEAGVKIAFINDVNPIVKKTIYEVQFVPATAPGEYVTSLRPVIEDAANGDQFVVLYGTVPEDGLGTQGSTWRYEDSVWVKCQQKTVINQAPLFDVFNADSNSIGNPVYYPGTTFAGTKLFSYTPGTGANDVVLGFPIAYSGVNNIGDIKFDVNLNSDTFNYNTTAGVVTKNINIGFIHYSPVVDTTIERTGWIPAAAPSFQYQVLQFRATQNNQAQFTCDVPAVEQSTTPWNNTQVYINDNIIDNSQYTLEIDNVAGTTVVTLNDPVVVDTEITVLINSKKVSPNGYYQIPANLQNNPFNTDITTVDVGDLRNQYRTIFSNAPDVTGTLFGQNNVYNLGDLTSYGTAIIQSSASLILPGVFLRKAGLEVFNAMRFNADEYINYKQLLISTVDQFDFSIYQSPSAVLDTVIYAISSNKNNTEPFFWSDMLPSGSPYISNTYTFSTATPTATFPLGRIYDFKSANYYGITVAIVRTVTYTDPVTGNTYEKEIRSQLIIGVDYVVSDVSPSVIITYPIREGDTIRVEEYNQTYGSYCPNTPTKLGLYNSYIPGVILDSTYSVPTWFIVGHDGSYNKLYGTYDPVSGTLSDFKDQALLEFEQRVFNNLKVSGAIPLSYSDVFPGQFRTTEYSREELLQEYSTNFLRWVGKNRIDYKTNIYNSTNEFTFNYNQTSNVLDNKQINQGYWRGVYNWMYDTDEPATKPWEMLGLSKKPSWWESRYGAAPYTSGNSILWADLAAGYVWNNGAPYVDKRYVRPRLLEVLPVDGAGNLLSPFDSVVKDYNSLAFDRAWVVGDQGPAETSYLKSSTWPFDLMRVLALTKPAKFFNLFADRDLYKFDPQIGQYLYDERSHLDPRTIEVYGNGVSKASYINWVVDYINQRGVNGTDSVTEALNNIDVRLTYNVAGFTSKNYLKFLIEKSTPNTQNSSLLVPDDSYAVLLYDNVPEDMIAYSSVIIQKTEKGYTVWGNSQDAPYFTTALPKSGIMTTITVGTTSVKVSQDYYADKTLTVPYGTLFYSLQGVCEFLVNYGRYLADQGVMFDLVEGSIPYDWQQMTKEFLYWAGQGWQVGSTISLNPDAKILTVNREGLVVQPLTLQQQNFILNQNLLPLQQQNTAIVRENTSFTVSVLSDGDAIAYTNLNLSSMEHAVVFDNFTVFNDTIYNLVTGLRQPRLLLKGYKTGEWNGFVNASGFILNEDDVAEWQPNVKYAKGQIVTYKSKYWAANVLIEAQAEFSKELWTETSYDQVKTGLLPNPSTSAYESLYYYDSYKANLENDADLLSFSLIGYRPRQYLQDADLSDITQINVYKNIIKEKGTNSAANAFKNANLAQGEIDYKVKENWAIKTADFGSVLSSNYVEAMLAQSKMTSNPSLIGFSNGAAVDNVQMTVLLNELINYERKPSSPNFLPSYGGTYVFESGLPSAGYVNLSDVKFKTFNLLDLNDSSVNVDTLYRGDVVWVASYEGSWTVLQATSLGTQLTTVTNNLDGTVVLTFTQPHNLLAGDAFAIVNFDPAINRYYTVNTVNSIFSVTVDLRLDPSNTVVTGLGTGLKLNARRFAQASDLVSDTDTTDAFFTKLSWIDNGDQNQWRVWANGPVYKQQDLNQPLANEYGASVAYSKEVGYLAIDSLGKLYRNGEDTGKIAAPGAQVTVIGNLVYVSKPGQSGTGRVLSYTFDGSTLVDGTVYTADNTGAISAGIDPYGVTPVNWVFVGNSTTNSVKIISDSTTYTVTGPAGSGFGSSIAVSTDGIKLIIGAPNETILGLPNAGAAYVYSRTANQMIMINRLLSTDPQNGSLFGSSVITNRYGAQIIVGSPFEMTKVSGAVSTSGAVHRWTNAGQCYGVITGKISTPTPVSAIIHIDDIPVVLPSGTTAQSFVTQINAISGSNLTAVSYGDDFTISNSTDSVDVLNDLIDLTATPDVQALLGIELYTHTQRILDPNDSPIGEFGRSLALSSQDALVIGAPAAYASLETTFDFTNDLTDNDTIFDNGTTTFIDNFSDTGCVFEYDYLPAYNESIHNPGKFVFGQYIQEYGLTASIEESRWGSSVAINDGVIAIGAPKWKTTFSGNTGLVGGFKAIAEVSSWYVDKQPLAIVDINGINNISIYDTQDNETLEYLDYIDPIQGKLLGAVETNIDFTGGVDPAIYVSGEIWLEDKVGQTWLDTTNIRMLNCNQPDTQYNSINWGKAFPGSTADIYTWIQSSVNPVDYSGPGIVVEFDKYTTATVYDRSTNSNKINYYYWVKNFDLVPPGKTLSPITLSQYILNPQSSGIAYLAPLTTNIVGLYNTQSYVQANYSALHIGYGGGVDQGEKHTSWSMIQEDEVDSFLPGFPASLNDFPTSLYLKYIESFTGKDDAGRSVPDMVLPPLKRYGVSFRPRQSMFRDRPLALENYVQYNNSVLKDYPITESRNLFFLNKSGTGYDTRDYWKQVDWWAAGYSSETKIIIEVPTVTDLQRISAGELLVGSTQLFLGLEDGLVARVTANRDGNSETWIFRNANGWNRIGLNKGTIEILDTVWNSDAPAKAIYWIVRWLNEQAYVDELTAYRNRSLTLMLNYIQSEAQQQQNYLPWLNKTSLVDVSHRVRGLLPYKKFQRDNQEFLAGYLNEIKPYHVYIKDFAFTYDGVDVYQGNVSDFDLPSQYNAGQFVSPQLRYSGTNGDGLASPYVMGTGRISVNFGDNKVNGVNTAFTTELNNQNAYLYTVDGVMIGKVSRISSDDFLLLESNSNLTLIDSQYKITNSVWQQPDYAQWFENYGLSINSSELNDYVVTNLTSTLSDSTSASTIYVQTVYGMPWTGVIRIGTEQIRYSGIDRVANTLLYAIRGYNATPISTHYIGAKVKMSMPSVIIVDQGRGYKEPPTIEAFIDTTVYPYPRQAAALIPAITDGKLTSVTVQSGGDGYAVSPILRVESSSITSTFNSSAINPALDMITIPAHKFQTGDSVVYRTGVNAISPAGLIDYEYYYVYVIDQNNIALYDNYEAAMTAASKVYLSDGQRIRISSQGTGEHRIGVTAKLVCFTNSQPIREFTITMKFDRVTYDSAVVDWAPGKYYTGIFIDPEHQSSSDAVKASNDALVPTPVPANVHASSGGIVSNITAVGNISGNTRITVLFDSIENPGQLNGQMVQILNAGWTSPQYYYLKLVSASGTTGVYDVFVNNLLLAHLPYNQFTYVTGAIVYLTEPFAVRDSSLVRNANKLWRCIESNNDSQFIASKWEIVTSDASFLTAADRVAGFYKPTAEMPGLDLTQLMTGMDYPNATFAGGPLATSAIKSWTYDTYLQSPGFNALDDINNSPYSVHGGEFASGYGPEELVPGIVTDSLNFNVTTKPGLTWDPVEETTNGRYDHSGFNVVRFAPVPALVGSNYEVDFSNKVVNPVAIAIYNTNDGGIGLGPRITEFDVNGNANYTINWNKRLITLNQNYQSIEVVLYEVGGGNEIVRGNNLTTPFRTTGNHSSIYLDADITEIDTPTAPASVMVTTTSAPNTLTGAPSYVTCLSVADIIVGDVVVFTGTVFGYLKDDKTYYVTEVKYDTNQIAISLLLGGPDEVLIDATGSCTLLRSADESIAVWVDGAKLTYGVDYIVHAQPESTAAAIVFTGLYDNAVNYATYVLNGSNVGFGVPETQYFFNHNTATPYTLTNFAGGSNPYNAIVEIDGVRVNKDFVPDITYTKTVDLSYQIIGVTGTFDPTAVKVYIGGSPYPVPASASTWQVNWVNPSITGVDAEFGGQFGYLDSGVPLDTSGYYVVFSQAYSSTITDGTKIRIAYDSGSPTASPYTILWNGVTGTITFNDPIFNAASVVSVTTFNRTEQQFMVTQVFDTTYNASPYQIDQPLFTLTDVNRLWVSIDGKYVAPNRLRLDNTNKLYISGPVFGEVAITSMSPGATPGETSFRINVDKSGYGSVYNTNANTRTYLVQDTRNTGRIDDVLHVHDVSKLVQVSTVVETGLVATDSLSILCPAANEVTYIGIMNNGNQIAYTEIVATRSDRLTITLAQQISGDVEITFATGTTCIIQNEEMSFTSVDLVNNTLTGLSHGQNGTITNAVYQKYSQVQSVLDRNHMSPTLYDTDWYYGQDFPLQLDNSEGAQFLNNQFFTA